MDVSKYKLEFLIETVRKEDISDEVYFSPAYENYVSNSKLSYINPDQGGSPQKYKEGIKSSYNSSFEFGGAVHALFLQPNDFVLSGYTGKPTAKLGVFIDEVLKARRKDLSIAESLLEASTKADYYSGKLSPKIIKTAMTKGFPYYMAVKNGLLEDADGRGVIVLSGKQQDDVKSCLINLKNNSKIRNAMFMQNFFDTCVISNEDAIFVDVCVTLPGGQTVIIPIKGKLDNYRIDPSEKTVFLNDLKTTGKPINYFMGGNIPELDDKGVKIKDVWIDGSFQKFHYSRQMALYLIMLQLYCKSIGYEGYKYSVNMAVVQSFPEFSNKLYEVPTKYITQGMAELKELLCRVAWHELNGYDKELIEE